MSTSSSEGLTLVTGGAGYVGSITVDELLESGRRVRVLDSLLHGQEDIASGLESRGVEVIRADIRDGDARRAALEGVDSVVHLAAIVGDPACAQDVDGSNEVNVDAAKALVSDARDAGVKRFLFASTCSNYGETKDPLIPISEKGELNPVSLYAEQKIAIEGALMNGSAADLVPTCLRLSTVYGVSPRMRFDLTVNEFARDLWAGRDLEVFGEDRWRAYIHVRDAARAFRTVLDAPEEKVAREIFNAGNTGENYRKLDIVGFVQYHDVPGKVTYTPSNRRDPRDYKVNSDKILDALDFRLLHTVPYGIREVIEALEAGKFEDPFDRRYRNIP